MQWFDPKQDPFQVSGFAWLTEEGIYRRFPRNPTEKLPDSVDQLANCTSGGQIRFQTDAQRVAIQVQLSGKADMDHMTAVGQCGFDMYIGAPGNQRFVAAARPPLDDTFYESTLVDLKARREEVIDVTLNFPLYQGVEEVKVGLDEGAEVTEPTPYHSDKRVLFYGTSITQGGCASRPGMSYTNLLSRRIPLEMINLGFSGSGKGEKEVALVIRGIERPGCLVIDYEANVDAERYKKTLYPFIKLYREIHPQIPILVISRIRYANEFTAEQHEDFLKRRNYAEKTVAYLQAEGDRHIAFLDGSTILGEHWHECTVDGVHPNDYGFMRMADEIEGALRRCIQLGELKLPT
ncbi:hypothetical protein G4V62_08350 [Bacillaceae bacterium SIJ1]|uniref:SGNH/GDSL hydrolase family protein n=1 Tax=Litoribacterium kuwaitense TaxID=1398745 RepID=UPI0013EBABD2|nr:SGNH/GDSL hydrolase family protein [Litoribacterium kuwaitense]NGP44968.1 hypothetical protein [Litoribacterium kuwaitense]